MITNNNSDNRKKTANNKQVKHNAIAHHLLTEARPPPWTQISPFWVTPPVYTLSMFYGVTYPPGQFESPVLAVFPPKFNFFLVYQWQSMKHIKKKEFLT